MANADLQIFIVPGCWIASGDDEEHRAVWVSAADSNPGLLPPFDSHGPRYHCCGADR